VAPCLVCTAASPSAVQLRLRFRIVRVDGAAPPPALTAAVGATARAHAPSAAQTAPRIVPQSGSLQASPRLSAAPVAAALSVGGAMPALLPALLPALELSLCGALMTPAAALPSLPPEHPGGGACPSPTWPAPVWSHQLCGGDVGAMPPSCAADFALFDAHLLSRERFEAEPHLLHHPDLRVKVRPAPRPSPFSLLPSPAPPPTPPPPTPHIIVRLHVCRCCACSYHVLLLARVLVHSSAVPSSSGTSQLRCSSPTSPSAPPSRTLWAPRAPNPTHAASEQRATTRWAPCRRHSNRAATQMRWGPSPQPDRHRCRRRRPRLRRPTAAQSPRRVRPTTPRVGRAVLVRGASAAQSAARGSRGGGGQAVQARRPLE
jgi:hypothetical protein